MFNLDQTILEWRRKMLAAGIKTPVPLDELESHLRDEIEQQTKSGLSQEEAFNCAVQKIGQAHALENEFKKVGRPGDTMIYPFLLLAWNTTAGLYFLPGQPSFCLIMILVSLAISMFACYMNPDLKFISVPSVTWPLLFIATVVLGTAMLSGGIGLHVPGSGSMGGKRYLLVLAAVLGYFALVAQRIPAHKADLYVKLFFLGALSAIVASPALFPEAMNSAAATGFGPGSGLATASIAIIALLLARYGLRGILDPRKYWRLLAFAFFLFLSLLGGYRSMVIDLALLCCLMFCLEGLFRTRLLPAIIVAAVLTGLLVIPLANKLPHSVQRSLSFLPLHLDKDDVNNAKASSKWRVKAWKNIWPQVPHHLILGKGLGGDAHVQEITRDGLSQSSDPAAEAIAATDFHNGPISVVLPFGLLGVIAFVWFLVAGWRVLYLNYKFGDPALLLINRSLFALFITKAVMFFLIFGSFYSEMVYFVGFVGLSIALNGGLRNSIEEPASPQPVLLDKLKRANG